MKSNKLLNFKTENFKFCVMRNTLEERAMIKSLEEDIFTKKYLTDFANYLLETNDDLANNILPIRCTNIIYKNEFPIGVLSFLNLGDNLIISYGLAPKDRGNKFMKLILEEVTNYLFSTDSCLQRITYYIDVTNISSIRTLSNEVIMKITQDKKTNKQFYEAIQYNPYFNEQRYRK